jgi:hypothetical protein
MRLGCDKVTLSRHCRVRGLHHEGKYKLGWWVAVFIGADNRMSTRQVTSRLREAPGRHLLRLVGSRYSSCFSPET